MEGCHRRADRFKGNVCMGIYTAQLADKIPNIEDKEKDEGHQVVRARG